jgi:hypothetical protein
MSEGDFTARVRLGSIAVRDLAGQGLYTKSCYLVILLWLFVKNQVIAFKSWFETLRGKVSTRNPAIL